MSAMSLDGPSYHGWTPDTPSSTTTTPATPATPNIPQGKSDLHNEDVTPPSSPPLTPQGLRSFSDFDMPGGWRKSFGAAAAPPQSGPQRTNEGTTRASQRHEHAAPYNKDPSPGNSSGGTPLQTEETIVAEDLGTPFRRPAANHQQPHAYKRQHANQRPCRPGLFAGGNHVPHPGATATAAQAQANFFGFSPGLGQNTFRQSSKTFRPYSYANTRTTQAAATDNNPFRKEQRERMMEEIPEVSMNAPVTPPPESPYVRPATGTVPINPFAYPPKTKYSNPLRTATPDSLKTNNDFMPTPPSSHPSSDNEADTEDHISEDEMETGLRWKAARASAKSHRAAASVRKARADIRHYINQREAEAQRAREMRRREAERKKRNEMKPLKEQQAAWWNSLGGGSTPFRSQPQHQQRAPEHPSPVDIQWQYREIEERERQRQALVEQERQRVAAYQQQMRAEQERQERLRREAEERAAAEAAAREAERLRLLREHELQERLRREAEERAAAEAAAAAAREAERLRLLREQEEERMRQQASWEEQQRRLHEEQQRKLHEEQERERQQREYADANWRRILLEQCRLAMQKMRTDAAYLHECRETYESTWAELTRPIPSPGCPKYINVVYFPWPCSITFALDVTRVETLPFIITADSVGEFLNRGVSDVSEIKRRLRKASARFHPDKIGRIYPRLRDEDREFVMAGFELVQIQLNLLMEQLR